MTYFLQIIAALIFLTLILIPAIGLEFKLLDIKLIGYRQLAATIFQHYQPGQQHEHLLIWLPILAVAVTGSQLALLLLPTWPFYDFSFFGPFDFLAFIVCSFIICFFSYLTIWLRHVPGSALFLTTKLNQLLTDYGLLLIIMAPLVFLTASGSFSAISQQEQKLVFNLIPAWNLFLLPVPFISMFWLLVRNYQQRRESRNDLFSSRKLLVNHSSFERLLINCANQGHGLNLTIFMLLLFFGGFSCPGWLQEGLGLQNNWLLLLYSTLIFFIKLLLILLVARYFINNYVEQNNSTNIRITVKLLIPANLLQLALIITILQLHGSLNELFISGMILWSVAGIFFITGKIRNLLRN